MKSKLLSDVLAATPTYPDKPAAASYIHKKLGYGALVTVRHVLRDLAEQELLLVVPDPRRIGPARNLYWRTDGWVR